jgi:hypothetical protein
MLSSVSDRSILTRHHYCAKPENFCTIFALFRPLYEGKHHSLRDARRVLE